jgi:peptidoglycan/xylan/chitin deacetylase (PgdA/CDA1 family)
VQQEKVPFNERGGRLRGCLDAISGRFPRFVFGGRIGDDVLPVFHFHDESATALEPKLRYLAENGYQTVTSDEIADFVGGRLAPGPRRVGLCFDDAWSSLWTVAAPLLRRYGLRAIVYAIPGRIEDSAGCRPVKDVKDVKDVEHIEGGSPLVTWPELRALHASGIADVQCHTLSHSRIFCSTDVVGFVTPDYEATPLLNRPQLASAPALRFVTPADLGAPLYTMRSRMSDGRRVSFAGEPHTRCVEYVARSGGADFFKRPGWAAELEPLTRDARPELESEDAQRAAIEDEIDRGRSLLNDALRTTSVNHICLPWGVSGAQTVRALERVGYRTAFANRIRGVHAVRRGDHPYWLKRLPNKYIFHLPGRGRRLWR